jgi:hypothetical protein
MEVIDIIFIIVVYIISIYLIQVKDSIYIKMIGIIIFLAHMYKDFTCLNKWPKWTEYVSVCMGIVLIIEGNRIKNKLIPIIGLLLSLGHVGQLIFNDDRYYY